MKKTLKALASKREQPACAIDSADRAAELAWRYAWIDSAQAIAYLQLGSTCALYRLIREHRLPHGRRGGLYRFRRADLDAWVLGNQLANQRSA